jgi:hypothetical protein
LSRNREGEKFMRAMTLKSTLCIGLAVAAIEDGERVLMLETAPGHDLKLGCPPS